MTKKENIQSIHGFMKFLNMSLIPLILMAIVPNLIVLLIDVVVHNSSNLQLATKEGLVTFWKESWFKAAPVDVVTWCVVGGLFLWASLCFVILPGRKYDGPMTQTGYVPVYIDSGFTYYLLTVTITLVALLYPNLISAWNWYKKGSTLSGTLIITGLIFCFFLWVKGHVRPSPGGHGSSGNLIFDFYWGMELHPRIGPHLDLKVLSNSRFGMMSWQIIVLFCWKAQIEHSGWNWSMVSSTLLQSIYLAKFFWLEECYMRSIDIIFDRAGFYICWGCMNLLPTFYTITSLYMVENAQQMTPFISAMVLVTGIVFIGLTYWADHQRLVCRLSDGNCTIWRKKAKVVRAIYTDLEGKKRTNLLLASGFWSIGRHFNYTLELSSNITWVIPAVPLLGDGAFSVIPFLTFAFLTVIIIHRIFRDEFKCRNKYGKYWEEYCRLVPYSMIPFIF